MKCAFCGTRNEFKNVVVEQDASTTSDRLKVILDADHSGEAAPIRGRTRVPGGGAGVVLELYPPTYKDFTKVSIPSNLYSVSLVENIAQNPGIAKNYPKIRVEIWSAEEFYKARRMLVE